MILKIMTFLTAIGTSTFLMPGAFAQGKTEVNEKIMVERANEVLRRSQEVIYQGKDLNEIKGLRLSSVTNRFDKPGENGNNGNQVFKEILEETLQILDEDNVRVSRTEYRDGAVKERNSTSIVSIINGNKSSTRFSFVSNGISAEDLLASKNVPANIKKQMRESFDGIKQISKTEIQTELWMQLFPLLLKSPWNSDDVFAYIGKAESDEIRADILELISRKNKRIRFFFNEKTHLLLMTTIEEDTGEFNSKTTNYYSDYEEMDGILIARKIVSDSEIAILVETEFLGRKIYPRTTTRIKERIIREFEVNPKLSPDLFVLNGRQP